MAVALFVMFFSAGLFKDFAILSIKVTEYSELGEIFSGSLEDKNVENNAKDGSRAFGVSQGS